MIKKIIFFCIISMLILSFSGDFVKFGLRQNLGKVRNGDIDEASGLALSRINQGILWTHNDSGDDARIFAVGTDGRDYGQYRLRKIKARDIEDIAVGPGPKKGKSYVYLADIGDNRAKRKMKYIYRFEEPHLNKSSGDRKYVIKKSDIITFRYPDGRRDAETLLIDPLTRDLIIVTKREEYVRVYKLAYPQSTKKTITAEHIATLTIGNRGYKGSGITAGDISGAGTEILLKSYARVYYYIREADEDLVEAFASDPMIIRAYKYDLRRDPMCEAICWGRNARGFYTVSEERFGVDARIFYYPRLEK